MKLNTLYFGRMFSSCQIEKPGTINEKCKLSLPLILSFSTHDSITVKEEVVKVIGEVRGFKPVRLSFK